MSRRQYSGTFKKVITNVENYKNEKMYVITRNFNSLENIFKYYNDIINKNIIIEGFVPKITKDLDKLAIKLPNTSIHRYDTAGLKTNSVCEHIQYVLWLEFGNKMFMAPNFINHSIHSVASVSGKQNHRGENPIITAIREFKEETNYDIEESNITIKQNKQYMKYNKIIATVKPDIAGQIINAIKEMPDIPVTPDMPSYSETSLTLTENTFGNYLNYPIIKLYDDKRPLITINDDKLADIISKGGTLETYLDKEGISKIGFETLGLIISNREVNNYSKIYKMITTRYDNFNNSQLKKMMEIIEHILLIYIDKMVINPIVNDSIDITTVVKEQWKRDNTIKPYNPRNKSSKVKIQQYNRGVSKDNSWRNEKKKWFPIKYRLSKFYNTQCSPRESFDSSHSRKKHRFENHYKTHD